MYKYQKDRIKDIKNQLAYESTLVETVNRMNKRRRVLTKNLSLFVNVLFLILTILILTNGVTLCSC
mgnify:FL=1|jgi:hypothetical protein